MAPCIDIVYEMMTQLDEVSQDVPEGFYLQFCDHLKRLYEMHDLEPRQPMSRVEADLFGDPGPPRVLWQRPQSRPAVRRGIPARIRTAAERRADDEAGQRNRSAHDHILRDLFGEEVMEYRPTSPARRPRRL